MVKKFFTSLKQPLSNLQMLRSSPTTGSLPPIYKSLLTLHRLSSLSEACLKVLSNENGGGTLNIYAVMFTDPTGWIAQCKKG